jgi:lipid-A-disaccharide synthase
MKPMSFMLIAGEASGDLLAAELVGALKEEAARIAPLPEPDYQPLHTSLEPRCFGAGGPRMAAAGVELAFDMTQHAIIGLSDVLRNILKFRRLFHQLYELALEREPDAIICVDFSGFNRRFAHAIKKHVRGQLDWFHDWNPRIIQYVSPQVWASREGRSYQMAKDYDLVLSIFPFEKDWYARRVPELRVKFVGHPMLDRYESIKRDAPDSEAGRKASSPRVLLLPGSRPSELKRHLPVMLGALEKITSALPGLRAALVLPDTNLEQQARGFPLPSNLAVQVGGLPEALSSADIAIASTGTVTMECAWFGVPTVALYKTSWSNYQIGKRLVNVKYLAMPNLLASEQVFPEFIQNAANAENIAKAAIDLLRDEARREQIKVKLGEITSSLGAPGANRLAAQAVFGLFKSEIRSSKSETNPKNSNP